MAAILNTIHTRQTPLTSAEYQQALGELEQVASPLLRDTYLEDIKRLKPEGMEGETLARQVGRFRDQTVASLGMSVGRDHLGRAISASQFRFQPLTVGMGENAVWLNISTSHFELAQAIVRSPYFKNYFVEAVTAPQKYLALAMVIVDHYARPDSFNRVANAPKDLDAADLTQFAWELLARLDNSLGGTSDDVGLRLALGGNERRVNQYKALKGFVELAHLKPMSQRALAINDGLDHPFGIFAGQGAGCLGELDELINGKVGDAYAYPEVRQLYLELKPLFDKHNIDIDKLLALKDADQDQIENYIALNRVGHTLALITLVQALRIYAMEMHGVDFSKFSSLVGQSGGEPAAFFAAGAFELDGFKRPKVPTLDNTIGKEIRGYHSLQAYKNLMEFIIACGEEFEAPYRPQYDAAIEKWEPLVKKEGDKIITPKAEEIDAYFKKYHNINMSISGIAFDTDHPENSELGKLMFAIEKKFNGEKAASDWTTHIRMCNYNTGATETGKHSHYILMTGTPEALAELAKMIILHKAEGYSAEVQELVEALAQDENVRNPVIQTRILLAPHDPVVYKDAPANVRAKLAQYGLEHLNPNISAPVLNMFSGKDVREEAAEAGAPNLLDNLLVQLFHTWVDMPRVYKVAIEKYLATSMWSMGPSVYHQEYPLPASLTKAQRQFVEILGITGKDGNGVPMWERVTTTNPEVAFKRAEQTEEEQDAEAFDRLKKIKGVTAERFEGVDSMDRTGLIVTVHEPLGEKEFEAFKKDLFELIDGSDIHELLTADKIVTEGDKIKNNLLGLIQNRSGYAYGVTYNNEGRVVGFQIYENDRIVLEFRDEKGSINVAQQHYASTYAQDTGTTLYRNYKKQDNEEESWEQLYMPIYRADTRQFYRNIWNLSPADYNPKASPETVFTSPEETVTAQKLVDFQAGQLQLRDPMYIDPTHSDFQAHAHYLSDEEWQSSMAPAFLEKWDMDFTRVLHEGETILSSGVIKPGDKLITKSQIVRVEDFKKEGYNGRRVIIYFEKINTATGQVVKSGLSTMVSRIPVTGVREGKTHVLYKNDKLADKMDSFAGRKVYSNKPTFEQSLDNLALEKAIADLSDRAEKKKKSDAKDLARQGVALGKKQEEIPAGYDAGKIEEVWQKFLKDNAKDIAQAQLHKKDEDKNKAMEALAKKLSEAYGKLGVDAFAQLRIRRAYLPEQPMVAKGTFQIPDLQRLTSTYTVDPNPIHISNIAAILGGIDKGAIMQGMASLGAINAFVMAQLRDARILRSVVGIEDVEFKNMLRPGQEVSLEVRQVAYAEGLSKLEVRVVDVKDANSVYIKWNLVGDGPKTAFVFTGQGSQYLGMGNMLTSDPALKAKLAEYQALIPTLSKTARALIALVQKNGYVYNDTVPQAKQSKKTLVLKKVLAEAAFEFDKKMVAGMAPAQAFTEFMTVVEAQAKGILEENNYVLLVQNLNQISVENVERQSVINLFDSMNKSSRQAEEAQPMIAAYSLILFFEKLKNTGLVAKDAVYSGHSLGEWIALVAAGAIDVQQAFRAIYQRGFAMGSFNDPQNPEGLLWVTPRKNRTSKGILTPAHVDALQYYLDNTLNKTRALEDRLIIEFSNDNFSTQVMLGGHVAAITNPGVLKLLAEFGFDGVLFRNLPDAFHTSLKKEASDDFGAWMDREGNPFHVTNGDHIFLDIEAKTLTEVARARYNGDLNRALADTMKRQIAQSVQWRQNFHEMIAKGVRRFVEVGPRFSLVNMMKEELKYMTENKLIDASTQIELLYFDPSKDFKDVKRITFSAREAVFELKQNRPTAGAAKPKEEAKLTAAALAPVAALPTTPSAEAPVDVRQIRTAIDGYIAEHQADITSGKIEAHIVPLAEKLAGFGVGAREGFNTMLAAVRQTVAPATGGAGGPSLEDQIIAALAAAGVPKAKANSNFNTDLGMDSGGTGSLNKDFGGKLGVVFSDDEMKALATVKEYADALRKKGVGGGSSAPAAAATQGPTNVQKLEMQALEKALAALPGGQPVAQAAASSGVAVVDPATVNQAIDGFIAEKKPTAGTVADLAKELSDKLIALGAGARATLSARLAALTSNAGAASAAAPAAASSGPSLEDQIIAALAAAGIPKAKPSSAFNAELGMDSGATGSLNKDFGGKLGIVFSDDEMKEFVTVRDYAGALAKRGAGGGLASAGGAGTPPPAAGAAGPLSPEKEVEKQAIQLALASPSMQAPQGGVAVSADPALLAAVNARIEELEARLNALVNGTGVAGTSPKLMVMTVDGKLADALSEAQARVAELEKRLANATAQLSPFYMDSLATPHYPEFLTNGEGVEVNKEKLTFNPDELEDKELADVAKQLKYFEQYFGVYGFGDVTMNGGQFNLSKFYAWTRSKDFDVYVARVKEFENLTTHRILVTPEVQVKIDLLMSQIEEVERQMNRLANQIDKERLERLGYWITRETEAGKADRAAILKSLYDRTQKRLEKKGIITERVVSITEGEHVVNGSGSEKAPGSIFTRSDKGTLAHARRLTDPAHADPAVKDHLNWYLENGADLRGRRVLISQAGTITTPYVEQFLQQGAQVMLTDYARRSGMRDGRTNNDAYHDLYNNNAAEGANLTVAPKFQPGNRADEKTLIRLIELQYVRDMKQYEADKKKYEAGELETEPVAPQLPTMYMSGAAFKEYGSLTTRGNETDGAEVMAFSPRRIVLELARLHLKYKTGQQVVLVNLYTPNNNENLAAGQDKADGKVVPSAIKGSKTYFVKAALKPGVVVSQAFKDGDLVWKKGTKKSAKETWDADTPIIAQLDYFEGWGKSMGESVTLMSDNDYITVPLEWLAQEASIDLLTLTGSQLAAEGMATLVAKLTGRLKGHHYMFDHTHGFVVALQKGKFDEIVEKAEKEAKKIYEAKKKDFDKAEKAKAVEPSYLPFDGSLVDFNDLNIAVTGRTKGAYAAQIDDVLLDDDDTAVVGYGAVGPLGQDALTNYRGMLARGRFKGHEGVAWLGQYDFFNLARSMGLDVSKWDPKAMAESLKVEKKKQESWEAAFERALIERSGLQEMKEFKNFTVYREISSPSDMVVEVENKAQKINMSKEDRLKLQKAGATFGQRGDGSTYAVFKGGQTYRVPEVISMAAVVAGGLPGQDDFDWDYMGINPKHMNTKAYAGFMSKMMTAQILMSMGGYSPQELRDTFGPKNLFVALGTGLGDLVPFNEMTVNPVIDGKVANYLMAALLPDASTGQVATEMLGAEGMALAVVAACSTGNANIVLAVKENFSRYYLATKEESNGMPVDWQKVFTRLWFAGGVDYAVTFNSVFGFDAVGAIIREDVRKSFDFYQKAASRPDDKDRSGFVLGAGGGAVGMLPIAKVKELGLKAHGTVVNSGAEFMTDGYAPGKGREAYGRGQAAALFDAWDRQKDKLTQVTHTIEQIRTAIFSKVLELGGRMLDTKMISEWGLSPIKRKALFEWVNSKYGIRLKEKEANGSGGENNFYAQTGEQLYRVIQDHTRVLNKRVRITVIAHKTSTPVGDPFEENSLITFLSTVLGKGDYAHIIKTKGDLGHLLGGSSGMDAALTSLFMRFGIVPGSANLDNIAVEAGENGILFHHKHAVDLNDLYDPNVIHVAIRESGGFNAKNAAVVEVMGKLGFKTDEEALAYMKKLVERTMIERVQKRAERLGIRKMVFDYNAFPEVPVAMFRDLYEVYIRSDAIARYLFKKTGILKFDSEKDILSWVYGFKINADVQLKKNKEVDAKEYVAERNGKYAKVSADEAAKRNEELNAQVIRNQHNAIKYQEAYRQVQEIWDSIDPAQLASIGKNARARGLHQQTVVFYGGSDGMGLRLLLTMMKAKALHQVVMLHRDDDPTKSLAQKPSAFTPEVLRNWGKQHGLDVNMTIVNGNGILFRTRDEKVKDAAGNDLLLKGDGTPLDLPKELVEAIEKHLKVSKLKQISLFDNVAFGAPLRPEMAEDPTDPVFKDRPKELWVPSINSEGEFELRKVEQAKSEEQENLATVLAMGKNHPRLLELLKAKGWLGDRSITTFSDWPGSETDILLPQVYGGKTETTRGVLGSAKLHTKHDVDEKWTDPATGIHAVLCYPAFLSFALHQIPGGTLLGLIEKRLFEDIQAGRIERPDDIPPAKWQSLKFKSMTALAVESLYKLLNQQFEGDKKNRVVVDEHEKAIYKILAARVQEALRLCLNRLEERRAYFFAQNPSAKPEDYKWKLDAEETAKVLADLLPEDANTYTFQHVEDLDKRRALERKLQQEKNGIAALEMPKGLELHTYDRKKNNYSKPVEAYPFILPSYSPEINTAELAIAVIDAGGVGTLDAGHLKPFEKDAERVLRERQVKALKAGAVPSHLAKPDTLLGRIIAIRSQTPEGSPLLVNLVWGSSDFDEQLKLLITTKDFKKTLGVSFDLQLKDKLNVKPDADDAAWEKMRPTAVSITGGQANCKAVLALQKAGYKVYQTLESATDAQYVINATRKVSAEVNKKYEELLADIQANKLPKVTIRSRLKTMLEADDIFIAYKSLGDFINDDFAFEHTDVPALVQLIKNEIERMPFKVDAVIARRSKDGGRVNLAGQHKLDWNKIEEQKLLSIETDPGYFYPLGSSPRFDVPKLNTPPRIPVSDVKKFTFKIANLPDTYAGYSGIAHGGMIDGLFEAALDSLIVAGLPIDRNALSRKVNYLANATTGKPVRIQVEYDAKKKTLRMELEGETDVVDYEGKTEKQWVKWDSATYTPVDEPKVKKEMDRLKPALIADFNPTLTFACIPHCVAAGHQHDTGLQATHQYDEKHNAVRTQVSASANPYAAMMLAADDLLCWMGFISTKMWGFTADNVYYPLGALPTDGPLTLEGSVPDYSHSKANTLVPQLTVRDAQGNVVGIIRATFTLREEASVNGMMKMLETLLANPADQGARQTFAVMKKFLGSNFDRLIEAIKNRRDVGADPDEMLTMTRQALYDLEIPMIARGGFTTKKDADEAWRAGASAVMPNALIFTAESRYDGKQIDHQLITFVEDGNGHKWRVRQTPGVKRYNELVAAMWAKQKAEKTDESLVRRQIKQLLQDLLGESDAQTGLFLAPENVEGIQIGEPLKALFHRLLNDEPKGNPTGTQGPRVLASPTGSLVQSGSLLQAGAAVVAPSQALIQASVARADVGTAEVDGDPASVHTQLAAAVADLSNDLGRYRFADGDVVTLRAMLGNLLTNPSAPAWNRLIANMAEEGASSQDQAQLLRVVCVTFNGGRLPAELMQTAAAAATAGVKVVPAAAGHVPRGALPGASVQPPPVITGH